MFGRESLSFNAEARRFAEGAENFFSLRFFARPW
jgi:hypothetical protein